MIIEKITPQIAFMYIGQPCTVFLKITYEKKDAPLSFYHIERMLDGGAEIWPHLRSPETLTEDECKMLYHIETGEAWIDQYGDEENAQSCIQYWFKDEYKGPTGSPMVWMKMLEMGFDLFGLIPAGLSKEIKK